MVDPVVERSAREIYSDPVMKKFTESSLRRGTTIFHHGLAGRKSFSAPPHRFGIRQQTQKLRPAPRSGARKRR
jgi:hypothetical protein